MAGDGSDDYGMIVLELGINPDASTANLARDFGVQAQKMMVNVGRAMKQLPDGPFELVSHDFVQVGYKLLGTFIFKKVDP